MRRINNMLNRGEKHAEKASQQISSAIRLPKMELKTFDGSVLHWHEFWECFEHGVHNQVNLPDHQKLQYLKSSLRGAAFVAISDLEMKAEHYQVAVGLLKNRYGHKNVLRKAHLDGLEKLTEVNSTFEVVKLKRLYEELESHYKALLAINVSPSEYEATIVPKVLSKCPMQVRIKLTEEKEENEDIRMEELVNGLRKTVRVLERCGARDKSLQAEGERLQEKRDSRKAPWYRNNTPSAATLLSSDAKTKCDFCLGPHQSSKCTKHVTVKERKDVLKKYNRCFRCLKRGHMVRSCAIKENCKKCAQSSHHEAICVEKANISEPTGLLRKASPTAAVAYQTVMLNVSTQDGETQLKC
eukprot:gene2436-biopygen1319